MTEQQLPLWVAYIKRVSGDANTVEIAQAAGIHASNASRWLNGKTRPTNAAHVAAFAKKYERSPLEAFVAAEMLSITEALAGLSESEAELLTDLLQGRSTRPVD